MCGNQNYSPTKGYPLSIYPSMPIPASDFSDILTSI